MDSIDAAGSPAVARTPGLGLSRRGQRRVYRASETINFVCGGFAVSDEEQILPDATLPALLRHGPFHPSECLHRQDSAGQTTR